MGEETREYLTVEYLLSHGFEMYNKEQAKEICDMPFEDNEVTVHLREKVFDRQMFAVIFSPNYEHPEDTLLDAVYVQHDAGCGFMEIPFPWWHVPIEYFESVYYGIRGYKPKYIPLTNKYNQT